MKKTSHGRTKKGKPRDKEIYGTLIVSKKHYVLIEPTLIMKKTKNVGYLSVFHSNKNSHFQSDAQYQVLKKLIKFNDKIWFIRLNQIEIMFLNSIQFKKI